MGIRDHPTAPRSPWQNGHVERLIGSIRRESLDHLIVLDEAQLRRLWKKMRRIFGAPKSSAPSQRYQSRRTPSPIRPDLVLTKHSYSARLRMLLFTWTEF
jgi:transposase InsO family protein